MKSVRDKFSNYVVEESTPRPGLRPEEVAPSGQLTSTPKFDSLVFTRKRREGKDK